ncbi:hypothetical protein DFQ29_005334 [Apophysomyces sp. BC1021]|nr:hypothetical protein DFQ29_005334 [Apophysomyces sp. BC1021]
MSLLRDLRCQLTHIKLDGDIICEQHASRTLLPFITQLQFLKHLELSDDNSRLARRDETSYTVGDFESIHVACTQLERLDISGLSISMGVHDSILSMDFTQVSAAKNMRIFNLRDVDLDDDQCIGYFLFKYPQLDELGWYSDARYFDVEYFHDNLYMAIAKQYRQLKKLHLDGINLQCLHIDTPLDLSQPEFSAMMKSIRHTISDLQLIIEHAQDIVHLWQSLGQCQHLVRLKIVNRTYSTLDISLILSHCRYLQILSLIEGFAVAPAVRPSRHGLLKLELVSVILDVTYIASYLSDHCPRLESLVLLTCYDHSSSERAVNIYAPHHIFKTISITQLGRIRTENTGVIFGNDVVIVSITQIKEWDSNKQKSSEQTGCKREHNQKTRWYYLHDSVPYSDKTPVVYRLDKEAIRHMIQFPSLSTAEHVDGSSRGRKKWKKHADSGYIDIVCKTVDNLLINGANIQAC